MDKVYQKTKKMQVLIKYIYNIYKKYVSFHINGFICKKREEEKRDSFGKRRLFLYDNEEESSMGKFAKFLLSVVIIGGIIGGPIGVNYFLTQQERKQPVSYGQKLDVDKKKMNVVVSGDGEDTIVLYPNTFLPSPYYYYLPLTTLLNENGYKTVVIEPFGYGGSVSSSSTRNVENEREELHECLEVLGIDKFTLLADDFAGIMTMSYVNTYPEQIEAYVGLDAMVPKLNSYYDFVSSLKFFNPLHKFFEFSGWKRIVSLFNTSALYESPKDYTYSEQDKKDYRKMCLDYYLTDNQVQEVENGVKGCQELKDLYIPWTIPHIHFLSKAYAASIQNMFEAEGKKEVTLTIASESFTIKAEEAWEKAHYNPLNPNNKIEILDCTHQMALSGYKSIVKSFVDWKKSIV